MRPTPPTIRISAAVCACARSTSRAGCNLPTRSLTRASRWSASTRAPRESVSTATSTTQVSGPEPGPSRGLDRRPTRWLSPARRPPRPAVRWGGCSWPPVLRVSPALPSKATGTLPSSGTTPRAGAVDKPPGDTSPAPSRACATTSRATQVDRNGSSIGRSSSQRGRPRSDRRSRSPTAGIAPTAISRCRRRPESWAGSSANPIPIVAPCHRVTRGVETPITFVGGPERRRWLQAYEMASREAARR